MPPCFRFCFIVYFLLSLAWTQDKNPDVELDVSPRGSDYLYQFTFRDHKNRLLTWTWTFNQKAADDMASRLGAPAQAGNTVGISYVPIKQSDLNKMPDPTKTLSDIREKKADFMVIVYNDDADLKRQLESIKDRMEREQKGMFEAGLFHVSPYKRDSSLVRVDFDAASGYYRDFTRPIYTLIEKTLVTLYREKPTWENRLLLALSFVQDIPYGVPPDRYQGKIIGGVFSPPMIFRIGYGDCDSKVLLLTSILSHYGKDYQLAVIYQSNHALLAVQMDDPASRHYLTLGGEKYVPVESVGPAKYPLGDMGYPNRPILGVETLSNPYLKLSPLDEDGDLSVIPKGFSYKIRLTDEGGKPLRVTLHLITNRQGTRLILSPLTNMPLDDGLYYWGSFQDRIDLHLEEKGYFLNQSIAVSKNQDVPLSIDFKNALQVQNLLPSVTYNLLKIKRSENQIAYESMAVSSSPRGQIMAVLPQGEYAVLPPGGRFTEKTKTFTYTGGKYVVEHL